MKTIKINGHTFGYDENVISAADITRAAETDKKPVNVELFHTYARRQGRLNTGACGTSYPRSNK